MSNRTDLRIKKSNLVAAAAITLSLLAGTAVGASAEIAAPDQPAAVTDR